jgi:hypothetical protein
MFHAGVGVLYADRAWMKAEPWCPLPPKTMTFFMVVRGVSLHW